MHNEIGISKWIEAVQSIGQLSFSLEKLESELTGYSKIAIKRALNRLSVKGKIVSIYKGYYLIIPPEYSKKGILPPALFVDHLMNFIQREYYVSLLNAASFHGASHQQPQEYFITTGFPVLRNTMKNGLKINYISVQSIHEELIEKRKTETGYIKISNPALTAVDLIQFENRIGGIIRAANIIYELTEAIQVNHISKHLIKNSKTSTLQRLGYILEHVCENKELSDTLYSQMGEVKMYRIPLKANKESKGFSSKNRWNVIENLKIEIDE